MIRRYNFTICESSKTLSLAEAANDDQALEEFGRKIGKCLTFEEQPDSPIGFFGVREERVRDIKAHWIKTDIPVYERPQRTKP